MSHLTVIPHTIRNLNALKVASEKLGLEYRENQRSFKWFGTQGNCDHAIGLKHNSSAYEVGVVKKAKAEAEYELKFDSFDSALADVVGYSMEHLLQGYAQQLVLQEMPFGWDYTMQKQQNGDLIMELSH